MRELIRDCGRIDNRVAFRGRRDSCAIKVHRDVISLSTVYSSNPKNSIRDFAGHRQLKSAIAAGLKEREKERKEEAYLFHN